MDIGNSYDEDVFSKMAMDQPAMSSVGSNHHETMIVLEYCDRGSMQEVLDTWDVPYS